MTTKRPKRDIHLYDVGSVATYIRAVERIAAREGGRLWFRGHSQASFRLQPSGLRNSVPQYDRFGRAIAGYTPMASGYTVTGPSPDILFDEFKKLPFFKDKKLGLRNDFEWMFLAQHYGVPTRLLDWTTNAMVALYFALQGGQAKKTIDREMQHLDEFSDAHAAVFVVDPTKANDFFWGHEAVVDISAQYKTWRGYVHPTMPSKSTTLPPVFVTARIVDERIRAQFGAFSLHGSMVQPLDSYDVFRPKLHKILIPHRDAASMRRQLRWLGMTRSFLLRDTLGLDKTGLAAEIVRLEGLRFDKYFARWLRANGFPRR